jgi:hypothetical protein
MPPESMLPAFASDAQAWRSSPVRAALLAQVTQWLRAETVSHRNSKRCSPRLRGPAPVSAGALAGEKKREK